MSDEEIDKAVKEAAAFEAQDKKRKEGIDAKNEADAMVFQTEKNLKDYGDKLPADKKSAIENACNSLKEAVKNQNMSDIEKYNSELEAAWHAASEDMARAAQGGPQGPQSGPQPGPNPQDGNDQPDEQ